MSLLRLKLEVIDGEYPRMSTILITCLQALEGQGYSVKWQISAPDHPTLIIDSERGAFPGGMK